MHSTPYPQNRLIPSIHLANDLSEKSVKSLLKMQICYRNSIKSKSNYKKKISKKQVFLSSVPDFLIISVLDVEE